MSAFGRRQQFSAHWFQLFNAITFQIVMGAPIIIYAKTLGASSTVLGIIASFTPLMTVFQLPAARHLDRHGYKRFVIGGWGVRTAFVFALALVPLLTFLDTTSKMAVMLSVLFLFNLIRGISSAGWMPWMTALIPEETRGRFLSVDQIFMYLGCLIALIASAVIMTGQVDPWEYSLVFLLSASSGAVSLLFIRNVPDVPPSETTRNSSLPVPWKSMLAYPPFRQLILFNLILMIVIGSLGVFTIEYLRAESHLEASTVMYLSAFSFLGSLVMLPFSGPWVDRVGSKPLLRVATLMFGVSIATWCLIAAGILPAWLWLIALLNFFTGAASANLNLASVRITMGTMPEMGRNHFFALFTVITSLGLGAAPVLWGVTLDMIGTFEVVTGAFHWKRHSIYFLALLAINAIAFASIGRLHEAPGTGRSEASLIYARLRRSSRVWHR